MASVIRNLRVALGVDFSESGVKKATRSLQQFEARLGGITRLARRGVGMAALAGGASSLGAALAPASAALAALPAAMAAARVASGTLKVGLMGVGNAMSAVAEGDAKTLNEAMKKLSPTA